MSYILLKNRDAALHVRDNYFSETSTTSLGITLRSQPPAVIKEPVAKRWEILLHEYEFLRHREIFCLETIEVNAACQLTGVERDGIISGLAFAVE